MIRRLAEPGDPVSRFIKDKLSSSTVRLLAESRSLPGSPPELSAAVAQALNEIIKGPSIHDAQRFGRVPLREETSLMLARKQDKTTGVGRLNRLLLEDAYPMELSRELHKEQFLRYAAVTMKRILWEAKEKKKLRPPIEGGDALSNLDQAGAESPADRLIAVQDAVDELAAAHPQAGMLVKLLCYHGKTLPEAATEMKLTLITAKRRWEFAKAWLFKKLNDPAVLPTPHD